MSSFLDKAKDLAEKAKGAAADNADKIDDAVDKAAGFVDDKTKGKYTDKVGKARTAAHRGVSKLAEGRKDEHTGTGTGTGPGDNRPSGAGPTGAGPTGAGPTGASSAGSEDTGPAGAGPAGTDPRP